MTDFRAGDTVRFRNTYDEYGSAGWYAGVLSEYHGYLRIGGADFTEHPDHYRPSGWRVIRPDGEPYSHYITDLTLIHRPAQEGTTMNTTVPLIEGDRVRYSIAGDHRLSGPLLPAKESPGRLMDTDPSGTYITTEDHSTLAPAITACALVERYGERVVTATVDSHPGLLSSWFGTEWIVAYVDRPDTDSMLVCETNDESRTSSHISEQVAERLGLPHELVGRRYFWLYRSTIESAGIELPTPLDDGATGDSEADAVDEVLQARIAELEAALEAERESRKAEMLSYKAQVKAAARRAGEDNGWCIDGQNEILRDLGIDVTARKRITVALKFDIIASTEESEPGLRFTKYSIRINPERLKDVVSMDSDWSNVEFDHAAYDVDVVDMEDEL